MTKRIFRAILLTALAVLLACSVLFFGVLYEHFGAIQAEQLKTELSFASAGFEKNGMDYLNSLPDTACRITLIAADGTVLFDSRTSAEEMENHLQREEVQEALNYGRGESRRYSATLTEQTLYYADRLSDGTVLRISISRITAISLMLSMLQPLCMVLALALVLSAVLAGGISKKIVRPLELINCDRPLENDTYEELSPILKRIEQQHKQISAQRNELQARRNEFYSVISRMSEGLVLLSKKGEILSINPAALDFFSADKDCIGKDFISIDRSIDINDAVALARENSYSELELSRGGHRYLLRASSVDSTDGAVVLLIFDNTERVFAEQNRREFTANVSHELKTPLQTIIGSAELLENKLVKPEDVPEFVGRIRSEAGRLLSLIDDIIRLSSLDEKSEMPFERVDLLPLAESEAELLRSMAEKRGINISVSGTHAEINGVRRLLHEIVFNLCDNALKYNVDGGSVNIDVRTENERAVITVKDSGIGIPKEHIDRVFERFYRVDKSRSRILGGTGLGLSIVKHAAEYMDGEIAIESTPGVGTEISVSFPVES